MNARILPDRPLTDAEKARRHRELRAAYVRALERAVRAAYRHDPTAAWVKDNAETLCLHFLRSSVRLER